MPVNFAITDPVGIKNTPDSVPPFTLDKQTTHQGYAAGILFGRRIDTMAITNATHTEKNSQIAKVQFTQIFQSGFPASYRTFVSGGSGAYVTLRNFPPFPVKR